MSRSPENSFGSDQQQPPAGDPVTEAREVPPLSAEEKLASLENIIRSEKNLDIVQAAMSEFTTYAIEQTSDSLSLLRALDLAQTVFARPPSLIFSAGYQGQEQAKKREIMQTTANDINNYLLTFPPLLFRSLLPTYAPTEESLRMTESVIHRLKPENGPVPQSLLTVYIRVFRDLASQEAEIQKTHPNASSAGGKIFYSQTLLHIWRIGLARASVVDAGDDVERKQLQNVVEQDYSVIALDCQDIIRAGESALPLFESTLHDLSKKTNVAPPVLPDAIYATKFNGVSLAEIFSSATPEDMTTAILQFLGGIPKNNYFWTTVAQGLFLTPITPDALTYTDSTILQTMYRAQLALRDRVLLPQVLLDSKSDYDRSKDEALSAALHNLDDASLERVVSLIYTTSIGNFALELLPVDGVEADLLYQAALKDNHRPVFSPSRQIQELIHTNLDAITLRLQEKMGNPGEAKRFLDLLERQFNPERSQAEVIETLQQHIGRPMLDQLNNNRPQMEDVGKVMWTRAEKLVAAWPLQGSTTIVHFDKESFYYGIGMKNISFRATDPHPNDARVYVAIAFHDPEDLIVDLEIGKDGTVATPFTAEPGLEAFIKHTAFAAFADITSREVVIVPRSETNPQPLLPVTPSTKQDVADVDKEISSAPTHRGRPPRQRIIYVGTPAEAGIATDALEIQEAQLTEDLHKMRNYKPRQVKLHAQGLPNRQEIIDTVHGYIEELRKPHSEDEIAAIGQEIRKRFFRIREGGPRSKIQAKNRAIKQELSEKNLLPFSQPYQNKIDAIENLPVFIKKKIKTSSINIGSEAGIDSLTDILIYLDTWVAQYNIPKPADLSSYKEEFDAKSAIGASCLHLLNVTLMMTAIPKALQEQTP